MSWSLNAEGTHDEATQKITADALVPHSVKAALGPLLGEFSPEKKVTVSTHGHHDGKGGGHSTLSVATID